MTKIFLKQLIFFFVISIGVFSILLCFNQAQAIDSSAPSWSVPDLKIKIPTVSFSKPEVCGTQNGQNVYCVNWIGEYVSGIYKYLIGVVGILAAIMLMVGGVVWLTAGGSPEKVKQAQDYIKGSITGLVLALTSFLILNTINPDLVNFKAIKLALVKKEEAAKTVVVSAVCQNGSMTVGSEIKVIDFEKTPPRNLPPACASLLQSGFFNNNSGISPKILAAITARESGGSCNIIGKRSPDNDCGMMQINIKTAKNLYPAFNGKSDDDICAILNNDAVLNKELAINYIKQGTNIHRGNPANIFAYYNSGQGGLLPSKDCGAAYKAYQCCTNPGELSGTQNYVYETLGYVVGN